MKIAMNGHAGLTRSGRNALRVVAALTLGLSAATFTAGCNENDPTALARVTDVTVLPQDTTVVVGDSLRFGVELRDADGDLITGDRVVEWSASELGYAQVFDGGYVITQQVGVIDILARSGGATGSARLEIVSSLP